jgi:hypothetical protein
MSNDDSVHWHGRAKEMLARAEQMNEGVTKHVLRRVADACECLARTAEQRAKLFSPNPVSNTSVLPAEVRFAPRKDRLVARFEQMDECATEQVLSRVADACECLVRTAEERAKRLSPNPTSKMPLPAEAQRFAPRKDRLGVPRARVDCIEIPSFLKRGPREK